MATRVLAALLLAPPFLWCVVRGGPWLAAVMGLLAALALRELAGLRGEPAPGPARLLAAAAVGAAGVGGTEVLMAALAGAGVVAALPLALPPIARDRVDRAVTALAGLLLYALPFGLFGALREGPEGLALVASLLGLVWIQDSGAYFVGTAFGKHRLSPEVSPKKSWEGTLGGFALAVPAALGIFRALGGRWEPLGVGLAGAAGALAVAAIAAQLGDLAESGVKRAAGVKDSADLIPGHGGILDRFDAFAFAVPALVAGLALGRSLPGLAW